MSRATNVSDGKQAEREARINRFSNPQVIMRPSELRRHCAQRNFLYRFFGLRRHSRIMDCTGRNEFEFVLAQVDAGSVLYVVPYGAEHSLWCEVGRGPKTQIVRLVGTDEVKVLTRTKTQLSGQRVTDAESLRRAHARGAFQYQLLEPLSAIHTCSEDDWNRIEHLQMQVKKRAIIIHPAL